MKQNNVKTESAMTRYSSEDVPYYITRTWGKRPASDGIVHWHNDVEFTLVMNGEKRFLFENTEITVHEGDGLFINAGVLHKGCESSSDFICVRFHPILLCANEYMERKFITPVIHDPAVRFIHLDHHVLWQNDILEFLKRLYMFQSADADDMPLLAEYCFFGIWHTLYANMEIAEHRTEESTHLTSLKKMLEFIHDRYADNISLGEIAASAGVSQTACNSLFNEIIHDSPYHYLTSYRILQATLQLFETDRPVTDIALNCGFADASHFSRVFRETVGMTPRDYRNSKSEM